MTDIFVMGVGMTPFGKQFDKSLKMLCAHQCGGVASFHTSVLPDVLQQRLCARLGEARVVDDAIHLNHLDVAALPPAAVLSAASVLSYVSRASAKNSVKAASASAAAITSERRVELFELMAKLEALCARLAASRMTAAERTRLAERGLTGVRLSCQIVCDHDMTVRALSRLAGSGRPDAGRTPDPQIQPPPEWV